MLPFTCHPPPPKILLSSPSVIEFHHQAVHMDILADYFSEHYDMLIKDECVIVHIVGIYVALYTSAFASQDD